MITISLSINNNAATTVTTDATTLRQLAVERVRHAAVTAKLNGAAVGLDTRITQADAISFVEQVGAAQAPVVATPSAAGVIQVSFINNDGAGFADKIAVAVGMTISRLISQKGIDVRRYAVRVNGDVATADQVLNNGDKISVTPLKVEGAATPGTIDILYVNNDGSGFADRLNLIAGITIRQFFAQRTEAADQSRFLIRVNGLPATADQVLNNGDKVSITPMKIEGAVSA